MPILYLSATQDATLHFDVSDDLRKKFSLRAFICAQRRYYDHYVDLTEEEATFLVLKNYIRKIDSTMYDFVSSDLMAEYPEEQLRTLAEWLHK
jgi:hypothetical protein